MAPTWPPELSRRLQDGPGSLQDASYTPPGPPQDLPRRLQDRPQRAQGAPKALQEPPRRLREPLSLSHSIEVNPHTRVTSTKEQLMRAISLSSPADQVAAQLGRVHEIKGLPLAKPKQRPAQRGTRTRAPWARQARASRRGRVRGRHNPHHPSAASPRRQCTPSRRQPGKRPRGSPARSSASRARSTSQRGSPRNPPRIVPVLLWE